jgi:hypothetical protein
MANEFGAIENRISQVPSYATPQQTRAAFSKPYVVIHDLPQGEVQKLHEKAVDFFARENEASESREQWTTRSSLASSKIEQTNAAPIFSMIEQEERLGAIFVEIENFQTSQMTRLKSVFDRFLEEYAQSYKKQAKWTIVTGLISTAALGGAGFATSEKLKAALEAAGRFPSGQLASNIVAGKTAKAKPLADFTLNERQSAENRKRSTRENHTKISQSLEAAIHSDSRTKKSAGG